eukprot:scaffold68885_cov49-Phaeocystis_antarctica.AAC.2
MGRFSMGEKVFDKGRGKTLPNGDTLVGLTLTLSNPNSNPNPNPNPNPKLHYPLGDTLNMGLELTERRRGHVGEDW